MKQSILIQVLVCLLAVCSALYIKYFVSYEFAVEAAAYKTSMEFDNVSNLTFSNLAKNLLSASESKR